MQPSKYYSFEIENILVQVSGPLGLNHQSHLRSVHKLLIGMLLVTAVLGYVAGYEKLYAFHIVLFGYWVFVLTGLVKLKRQALVTFFLPFCIFIFMVVSMLWAPNKVNGLYFLFYFFCGFSIIFSVINYAVDLNRLNYIFSILAFVFMLNFLVGLLETTGLFRLPVSVYYGSDHTRPSGFNGNLNNFGFVFLAIFPFLFLHPSKSLNLFSIFLSMLFIIKLESKGFFSGIVFFFLIYALFEVRKKRFYIHFVAPLFLIFPLLISGYFNISNIELKNRSFTALAEINRGINLISSGEIEEEGSTATRASYYLIGVQELLSSNGLGVGIAGIGSILAAESENRIASFHNFFLEMLVDFGILPFFIVFMAYLYIALYNIQASRRTRNARISYYSKASGLSLLVMIPASIAPSSIIYVFTFWIVIGFSLSIYMINKKTYL